MILTSLEFNFGDIQTQTSFIIETFPQVFHFQSMHLILYKDCIVKLQGKGPQIP